MVIRQSLIRQSPTRQSPTRQSALDPAQLAHQSHLPAGEEREFLIDNLLVRIHFIIEMIWWTGLAPWEFESPLFR